MPDPRVHACRKYTQFTIVSCIPDYCYTPIGSSVVVLPYNLIAEGCMLESTSTDVQFTSQSSATANSVIPICQGDEKGTLGGVVSGTFQGKCEFFELKCDVRINQKQAVGQSMLSWMNNQNTLGLNKISGGLGVAGDVFSVANETLKKLSAVINENLEQSKKLYQAFDVGGDWAKQAARMGQLAKGAGAAGVVLDGASILTAENRTAEAMKKALEIAATAGLVAAEVEALPATLVVIGAKHSLEQTYELLDAAEQERRSKVVSCTDNNPARATVCSQAYGYPPVNYPIPGGFGF